MRILHIIHRYWPFMGGSERLLQGIAERMAAEGHEVTVFTTNAWDLEALWVGKGSTIPVPEELHGGVRIHRFPVRHLPLSPWLYPALRRFMSRLSQLPLETTPLLHTLGAFTPWVPMLATELAGSGENYDIVHVMNITFEGMAYPALAYTKRYRIPFILTPLLHLGEPGSNSVRRFYTMRHQLQMLRAASLLFAQTEMERFFLACMGIPARRIIKAASGVELDDLGGGRGERFRLKYGLEGPIVFYLGPTAYDKGVFHLLDAMKRLWAEGEETHLVLAGPTTGAFTNHLKRQPGLVKKHCHVLGYIPEQDKKDLLDAGDLLVMPSRTDSLGVVFLEAWAYRKPVIGARAGGIPELIREGEDGLLVSFGDTKALAEGIALLLRDKVLACRLGESGRRKVEDAYTWDKRYPPVRDAFEALVGSRVRSR